MAKLSGFANTLEEALGPIHFPVHSRQEEPTTRQAAERQRGAGGGKVAPRAGREGPRSPRRPAQLSVLPLGCSQSPGGSVCPRAGPPRHGAPPSRREASHSMQRPAAVRGGGASSPPAGSLEGTGCGRKKDWGAAPDIDDQFPHP